MGKGLSVVGERLVQYNVFYFERVELKKATEEHCCCYTLSCLQCMSVHLDQRKQVLTSTGHGITKLPGFAWTSDTPASGLHALGRTIKTLSSLELVGSHSLWVPVPLCGHCVVKLLQLKVWHSEATSSRRRSHLCNMWWESHSSFFQHKTPQQGIKWWSWQKAPHQHQQLLNFQLLFSHKLQLQKNMKCNLRKLSAVYHYVHFHNRCEINFGLSSIPILSVSKFWDLGTLNCSLKIYSLFVARVLSGIWSSFTLWINTVTIPLISPNLRKPQVLTFNSIFSQPINNVRMWKQTVRQTYEVCDVLKIKEWYCSVTIQQDKLRSNEMKQSNRKYQCGNEVFEACGIVSHRKGQRTSQLHSYGQTNKC